MNTLVKFAYSFIQTSPQHTVLLLEHSSRLTNFLHGKYQVLRTYINACLKPPEGSFFISPASIVDLMYVFPLLITIIKTVLLIFYF
jgi:hypothetical protein